MIMMLAATQSAFADAKVYQQTLKSTTWIIAKAENGYSTGSGVLVDAEKKWVVTNFHVVVPQRKSWSSFRNLKRAN